MNMTRWKSITRGNRSWGWAPVVGAMTLAPQAVMACATCFGSVDSQLAHGSTMGALVLLGVVLVVLGGILSAGLVLVARARRLGNEADDGLAGEGVNGKTPERSRF